MKYKLSLKDIELVKKDNELLRKELYIEELELKLATQ